MKTKHLLPILAFACSLNAFAQSNVGSVVRLDSAMTDIVPTDYVIEKVADSLGFTEGPVWSPKGYLLFSDLQRNTIYKWTKAEGAKPFIKPSGNSNGLVFDAEGRLNMCQRMPSKIARIEPDSSVTVLATKWDGRDFNEPNDLVFKKDGALYFTDPRYAARKPTDIQFNGVYRILNGQLDTMTTKINMPNGIAFSPDEKYLYVGNINGNVKVCYRFEVNTDGTLGKRETFFDASNIKESGSPDGIKVDMAGNVFLAGPGGFIVISPEGKHLGTIKTPELPTNAAWGDADLKTFYITARKGIYSIRLKNAGYVPFMEPGSVSVAKLASHKQLQAYFDAPARAIRLKTGQTGTTTACLFNLQGQRIAQHIFSGSESSIPANRLAPGAYVVRLQTATASYSKTVVVGR